jgi:hypothetical protein
VTKLRWLLFDRTEDFGDGHFEKFGFDTALLMTYRRVWKVGTWRLSCGCTRRFFPWPKMVLYRWRCEKHWAASHRYAADGEK